MANTIYLKNGFSKRKEIEKFNDIVQTDSLNIRTRNKLYNITMEDIFNIDTELRDKIIVYLYTEIFSKTYDDIPKYYGFEYGTIYDEIKNLFQTVEYNKVYDFIEGFINAIKSDKSLAKGVNTFEGKLTNKGVASALNLNYTELSSLIGF